jgi:tetratricopeptide (TPR) repeat protein
MKCLSCCAQLTDSVYCPICGCDNSAQQQAVILSGLYYNQGLEKAQIRDLSGAIDQLKRSLKFNKLNVEARNLLGLVYFETGEVVAALSEWVISKNIQPEENLASLYIANLQKDVGKARGTRMPTFRPLRRLQVAAHGLPMADLLQTEASEGQLRPHRENRIP